MTNNVCKGTSWWISVRIVLGIILSQDFPKNIPKTSSWRLLVGAWLIFALIVSTGYRSNLTAYLTLPTYLPRIETLKELVEIGAR